MSSADVPSNAPERRRLLLCEDPPESLTVLERQFPELEIHRAGNATDALALLERESFHVLVVDQATPGMTGVALLARSIELAPHALRILVAARPDLRAAVGAVNQARAFRMVTKPLDADAIGESVRRALDSTAPDGEVRRLREELRAKTGLLESVLAEKEGVVEARVALRTRQLETELDVLRARATVDESGALLLHAFRERVADELARAVRFRQPAAVLTFSVPALPRVELEHGRERAAEVARAFCDMLRLGSRRFDVIGRLGAHRFAVLLPQTDAQGAGARLDRLRNAFARFPLGSIEELVGEGGLEIRGAHATYPDDAVTCATLLAEAERALEAQRPETRGSKML